MALRDLYSQKSYTQCSVWAHECKFLWRKSTPLQRRKRTHYRSHSHRSPPCPGPGTLKLPCQPMSSLQPGHGGPQLMPSPERSKELLSGKSNSPAKHRSGHESARAALCVPELCVVHSLPWKVKAVPGLKDRGGVSAKRLQCTQEPHPSPTQRALQHQSHLLCTAVMLRMAHDSVLPTGPQEVEAE